MLASRIVRLVCLSAVLCFGIDSTAEAQLPFDVVHSFANNDPVRPTALTAGSDGSLYGITRGGGTFGLGTIYRLSPDGSVTVLHSFDPGEGEAWVPQRKLIESSSGTFIGFRGSVVYRITSGGAFSILLRQDLDYSGGVFTAGPDGTVFVAAPSGLLQRIAPSGEVTRVESLSASNIRSLRSLLMDANGSLYGIGSNPAQSGSDYPRVIFRLDKDGTVSTIRTLSNGYIASIFWGPDGTLYEVDGGYQFIRLTPGLPWTAQTLGTFYGEIAPGGVLAASDGNFYVLTQSDGAFGRGTLTRVMPALGSKTLFSFAGYGDDRSILEGRDGKIYVSDPSGGVGFGSINTLRPGDVLGTTHTFYAGQDGTQPNSLILARDGNLYGTTYSGGRFGRGTIFRKNPNGAETILYTFTGDSDGTAPGSLLQAPDGSFYGTTGNTFSLYPPDVPHGVFRWMPGAVPVTVQSLPSTPRSVMIASNGHLYATTDTGILDIAPTGASSVLHRFERYSEGIPSGVTEGPDGNLYGVLSGTFSGHATVFKMAPDGSSFETISSFRPYADWEDGPLPVPGLIAGRDGFLYGVAPVGVAGEYGTDIFRLPLSGGTPTSIYKFPSGNWSSVPVMQATDGKLYGLTPIAVFQLSLDGDFRVAHFFDSAADGSTPLVPFVEGPAGTLYGATSTGGPGRGGAIFRLKTIVPFAPDGFSVAPSTGSVRLQWRTVPGAQVYVVKRATKRGGYRAFQIPVTGTSFVDGSVEAGTRYYYVVTAINASGESTDSYEVSITAGRAALLDIDGDTRADLSIYRPSSSLWASRLSSAGYEISRAIATTWGERGDIAVPGDFDGDSRTDRAVFRPSSGRWFVKLSSTGATASYQWGERGDVPFAAHIDDDNKTDLVVFRRSTATWYLRSLTGAEASYQWGERGDVPLVADFDGDGKSDLIVFRPSTLQWYILYSTRNYLSGFSFPGDLYVTRDKVPVAGDFDGDGKADFATFAPKTGGWDLAFSSSRYSRMMWQTLRTGRVGDIPVAIDLDGDGRTDPAVFRPTTGEWLVRYSSSEFQTTDTLQWGGPGDLPLPIGERFPHLPDQDTDGDGRADIVWHHRSGTTTVWQMNGTAVSGGGEIASTDPAWEIVGRGDYDGDGRSDLLWRHRVSGALRMWLMSGTRMTGGGDVAVVDPSWGVAGSGDYNGDGHSDILWRRNTGEVTMWFMNGISVVGGGWVNQVDPDWRIINSGDYDGDGRADILWRTDSTPYASTSYIAIWFMDGTAIVRGDTHYAGRDSEFAGAGDFSFDGRADLVWKTQYGSIEIWFMGASGILSSEHVENIGPDWKIVGVADYNGDFYDDLLFRNSAGAVIVWFMNGAEIRGAGGVATVDPAWEIVNTP